MTATASAELIAELEAAVSSGLPDRRILMLRRLTHLLLSSAARLNESQMGIFDDVLVPLMERIEAQSLIQFGSILSDLNPAPQRALRYLACHPEISVAAPVLLRSQSLSDPDLVAFASKLGRQHLLAIAARTALDEALTDALLKRGDVDVCRVLAKNAAARFSENGYAAIVATAGPNKDVAESLAFRPDLPAAMLRELLSKLSDEVRLQFLKSAPPKLRQSFREALDGVATHVCEKASEPIIHSEAYARIVALNVSGKLNDSTVNRFAMRREATNVIASLCVLSGAPIEAIEPLMEEKSCDGLIIAGRASRLDWQTVLSIIRSRSVPQLSEQERARAREKFEKLSLSVAQQKIRFGLLNESAMKPAAAEKAPATAGTIS